ncbi:hypothetical protein E8E11_003235 [Didymella keratinophila]|nr:hypothetical protein E8E11_003235 [Didymella keratinophila]
MRINNLAVVPLAASTTGSPVDYVLSALARHIPSSATAAPRATPISGCPTPSSIPSHTQEALEFRQAPDFAPVIPAEAVATSVPAAASAAPAIPPVAIDLLNPAQAVPLAPPAASLPPMPATTTVPGIPPQLTGDDFVTVQWIETHIGTLRTWVPQTETFHFEAMSQAPLPGVGSIGMGTLTGKTGQTQTI